jgi:NAD-dependent deacetylase
MERTRIVVFTGAGISAESGLRTFRDSDGLWEDHRIEDVATPRAWAQDPQRVLRFYDERRAQVIAAQPNAAHKAIARLADRFEVHVVTQNVDDLHERAGSKQVLHLHGEIKLARSTADPGIIVPIHGSRLPWGAECPLGSQLRPHIVWFGEEVPLMAEALVHVMRAQRLLVVGTSLNVYPAARLVAAAPSDCQVTLVDPGHVDARRSGVRHIRLPAAAGVPQVVAEWMGPDQ